VEKIYLQADLESMEKTTCYKMATETGGGILFITEGVFGMRGQQGKQRNSCFKRKVQFPFAS
jgi:glycine C-acetyltransferase